MSSITQIRKVSSETQSLPTNIQRILDQRKPFCAGWTAQRYLKLEMPKQLIVLKLLQLITVLIQPFILEAIFNNLQQSTSLLALIPVITVVLVGRIKIEARLANRITQLSANMRHSLTMALFKDGLKDCPEKDRYLNIDMMNSHMQPLLVYHTNVLSAIYECFRMVFAIFYLYYKMKETIIVALAMGLLLAYFNTHLSGKITKIYELILNLRKKKINLITLYQTRLVDIKMSRLEQYIFNKMMRIHEKEFSYLTLFRINDVLNITSMQMTSVIITSITLAFFKVYMTPTVNTKFIMVLISILVMLLMPLNIMPWNFAAIKRALLCRNNIVNQFNQRTEITTKVSRQEKDEGSPSIIIHAGQITINQRRVKVQPMTLTPGVYSVQGVKNSHRSMFLQSLVGVVDSNFECKIKGKVGYVDSELSLLPQTLNSIYNDLGDQSVRLDESLRQLLISYHCLEIPLNNQTISLSSGQKLRLTLVRSTIGKDIVIIDANLAILGRDLKEYIENEIHQLAKDKIFIVLSEVATGQKSIIVTEQSISLQTTQNPPSVTSTEHQAIKDKYCSAHLQPLDQIFKKAEPKKIFNDPFVAFKFYKLYFHSKFHIAFIILLIVNYNIKRYYSVYILKIFEEKQFVRQLLHIVMIYTVCVVLRALMFAIANLKDWERLNKTAIMNVCFETVEKQLEKGIRKNINAYQNEFQTMALGFTSQINTVLTNLGEILLTFYMVMLRMPYGIFIPATFIIVVFVKIHSVYRSKIHPLLDVAFFSWLESIDVATNTFKNKKIVKAFGDEDKFTRQYENWTSNVSNARAGVGRLEIWMMQRFQLISTGFLVFILLFIAYDFSYLGRQAKMLSLIITFCIEMPDKLGLLIKSGTDLERQARCLRTIFNYSKSREELQTDRMTEKQKMLILSKDQKYQGLEIHNLSFKYCPDSREIVKDFSLSIKPGEKVLIVGRSNVGKTTLLKLLTGMHSGCSAVSSGFISYCPPKPLIFNAPLEQNLDPYRLYPPQTIAQYVKKFTTTDISKMSYQQRMKINMFRAQLYGKNGVVLYDQPSQPIASQTCLIVSSKDSYRVDRKYQLTDGKLQQL